MISRIIKYLSITKKEWNGMVILLIIIALVLIAPYIISYYDEDKPIDFNEFEKAVALLQHAGAANTIETNNIAKASLFKFNPNNLPDSDWLKLGLSKKQVSIIKNFEAKGGKFYTRADVKKIYSITAADYKKLEPYINLPAGDVYTSNKLKPGETVELNTADSAGLTRIHGIGPAFAKRIVEYRQRLGGFLNKEQLSEVYGIDAEKYAGIRNEISVNPHRIVKLNINEVEFEHLRKFPYLTNKQTNAIIQYRTQHGNYSSVDDMREIVILDDQILRKIAPYLNFK